MLISRKGRNKKYACAGSSHTEEGRAHMQQEADRRTLYGRRKPCYDELSYKSGIYAEGAEDSGGTIGDDACERPEAMSQACRKAQSGKTADSRGLSQEQGSDNPKAGYGCATACHGACLARQ